MARVQNTVDDHLLRGLSLFQGIDNKRLRKIASHFTAFDIPVDTEILREGEIADHFYILLEGRASLSVSVPGRTRYETIVSTLSKGQLLGWSALLADNLWKASAYSVKPCRLIKCPGNVIRDLCEQDHDIGYWMMKNTLVAVGERLAESRLQLLDIFGARDA